MITTIELSGKESDEQLNEIAWRIFADAHPHEAYDSDPDRFWNHFHAVFPERTRDEMVALLKE